VLRLLLRLQRLPRRPGRPPYRTLAPIRMARTSHPLRRVPRPAHHLRLPRIQLPLPPLPFPLQPRLPQPSPFLFRSSTVEECVTRLGAEIT
jgi:hypothetical protein